MNRQKRQAVLTEKLNKFHIKEDNQNQTQKPKVTIDVPTVTSSYFPRQLEHYNFIFYDFVGHISLNLMCEYFGNKIKFLSS